VPWYETIWVQLGLVGFCAIVFLSACIIWPIRPLIRRLRGKRFQVERREPIYLGSSGTLNLVFLIGFPVALAIRRMEACVWCTCLRDRLFCIPLTGLDTWIALAALAWKTSTGP